MRLESFIYVTSFSFGMDESINLHDYLEQIKIDFDLPETLTLKQVLKILKDEVSFRERLTITINKKVEQLSKTFKLGLKYKYGIKDLDDFKINFMLDSPIDLIILKKISELNLHYIFELKIYPSNTLTQELFECVLTLNKDKLDKIKVLL